MYSFWLLLAVSMVVAWRIRQSEGHELCETSTKTNLYTEGSAPLCLYESDGSIKEAA
jgi:hypothetical protein